MGGGLMQLVAYGAQDIYLTGNPQITFFKVVYRRHTNFAMECVEQTLNGSTTAGSTVTATVSRNGDLVGKMYVTSVGGTTTTNGSGIVATAEVEIGGQRIDKQTAEWMQIWNELSTPESKAVGLKAMMGDVGTVGASGVGMLQVPLQFWFNRNPGLALPLIALQYHEVKVKLTLGATGTGSEDAKLWADYIYLDTDERRRFAQVSHEYLIEQVQETSASASTTQKLNFNHPVKELVWTSAGDYTSAKLVLNGHDRFAAQEEEYFQLRQPFDHHTAVPAQNIPMSDRPNMIQPIVISWRDAGTATGDAVSTLHNSVSATSGTKTTYNLIVGTNFIPSTSASNYPKVGDLISFVARDAGETDGGDLETLKELIAQVTSITAGANSFTLALELEDDQDAIATAFTVSTTAQDLVTVTIVGRAAGRCRTSQLTTKINCYSFALKPEEHQPSGTCNFSRIDNAQLTTGAALTAADNVYAVNYNVLRVMSGMGGLAYSN
tara:strand:+ start:1310 stop:2788 length:1479 start_codon:yes stop_codon:yes gene_type:complete